MALHKNFPTSPHIILDPEVRWFPADEALRDEGYEKLLPPLVAELRKKVKEWRDSGYDGVSDTSEALLRWWFETEHPKENSEGTVTYFQYYFAQREAIETVIYLHEIAKIKDPLDLMKFDSSGLVSTGHFDETWVRYVCKMATGAGKTKVISLVMAWAYFHKLYEKDSDLAQNFLLIAPNIIVLERLMADFDGLKVFHEDPVLPDNGFEGRDWHNDFKLDVHIQDDVKVTNPTGNLFLTNIHRVYTREDQEPSLDDDDLTDYFLGEKPPASLTGSGVSVGEIVRDIDELVVFNDEAHHIHDKKLAWFQAIEDINNKLIQKDSQIALQFDVTATPKHEKGAIFVQTICDYPLVEAIQQNVVKHPVVPDKASRGKLKERESSKFTEQYKDYIDLGYHEWKKVYPEHEKLGKKAVLFVMTDNTKSSDEVAEYLKQTYPEFSDPNSVLTIHTNRSGEISEAQSSKAQKELEKLRDAANKIDSWESPYKAIVSVLMLREGWDVQNVTTIVGLRAFTSEAKILPEQTLGRGLRRMYRGQEDVDEKVSVVGTDAFLDFVESIKREGVELERKEMNKTSKPTMPLLIEVDNENPKKDIEKLDIEIPVLSPKYNREYKNLSKIDPSKFNHSKVELKNFTDEEQREIVFYDIADEKESHRTKMDTISLNWRHVVGYFTQALMKDMRLVSGYDVLYPKVEEFIKDHLFTEKVNLEDLNVLRNLSELEAQRTITIEFRKAINVLTVEEIGDAEVVNHISLKKTRPFIVKDQSFVPAKKSVFNKIVGDSHFELQFAAWLEDAKDASAYAKNMFAVNFKLDYQKEDGDLSYFYPDFIVRDNDGVVWIIETKGREDLDDIRKIERLRQWCKDINELDGKVKVDSLYVKQDDWESFKNLPETLGELAKLLKIEK
ncbi:MAG: DEAD/DEAH box helicase family protein [Waddliaceae bacterium]